MTNSEPAAHILKKNFVETFSKSIMSGLKIRGRVIGARRPFKDDGWDLDLTYICKNRIIVMGFPQSGTKSGYRNNWKDVSF
jgi:hypothetical protein